eukprot:1033517-Prymnesium_polylepis.1
MGPNAFDYYFERIDEEPRHSLTFEAPCRLVYELLHRSGEGYPYAWDEAVRQRTQRSSLFASVPIRPHARFVKAAASFWRERFGESSAPVLGVHYRGVDKNGVKVHLTNSALHQRYLSLIMQYLEKRPGARVLLVTDDKPFLDFARAALTKRGVVHTHATAARGKDSTPVFALRLSERPPPAQIGREVLLDTLLLSRCDFLIKGISMVSETA